MEQKDKSPLFSKLEELFGIDLRSLAFFRIGLGLVVLGDLIARSLDLRAFYTDSGVLPRAVLLETPNLRGFSLQLLSGSASFQAFLFLLTGLFALALTFGYRTRLATFGCWLLIISTHLRNVLILQSGDYLLDVFLFWSLFLPLGACWSMDRVRVPPLDNSPGRVLSGGSFALLLQICFVYWFAAINKTGDAWHNGNALFYIFNMDTLVTPFGQSLLGYPSLLKFLSHFTIWFEVLGPLLAFVPIYTGKIRILLFFLFWGFHLLLALCLNLGPFPFISMVGWVIFLPSEFWDKILNSTRVGKMLNLKFFRKIISGSPTTSPRQFRPIKSHWVTNALAFFFIMYALFWNLGTMNIERYQPILPSQYFWPGEFFGLVQKWGVFTNPSGEGGWFVIPGKLQDGSEVDILRKGAPLNWDKPKSVPATIPNVRWRKYLDWIAIEWSTDYRAYYGRYLCQQWNSHHRKEKTLASLRVYYLRQKILANFQKSSPEKILLWEGTCSMVDSSQPAPGPKLFL